jgi:ligand-binding SRPBCC domain-containing protein
MKIRQFKSELWLPKSSADVFPFFADATNLETLTPRWLHFKIITPAPIAMHEGTLIDYRLRVHGIQVRWRTRISVWQPPYRFVDEQIHGPYRQWIHEHTFEPRDGGTLTRDLVTYAVPCDVLIHDWLVRPDIEKIFAFRSDTLRKHFSILH